MKFNSLDKESFDTLNTCLEKERDTNYIEETVIQHIDTQSGDKSRFKDIRKISIGISKKDILSYRSKPKSAFYNCFVIILRIKKNNVFHEIHIKIFNTGKMEIPGIQNDNILNTVLDKVKILLQDITNNKEIDYYENAKETVLINSNFNCGYLINREKLYSLLKYKYKPSFFSRNFNP